MLQRILLSLLTDPGSIAEVDRARETYAQRRHALSVALRARGVAVRMAVLYLLLGGSESALGGTTDVAGDAGKDRTIEGADGSATAGGAA